MGLGSRRRALASRGAGSSRHRLVLQLDRAGRARAPHRRRRGRGPVQSLPTGHPVHAPPARVIGQRRPVRLPAPWGDPVRIGRGGDHCRSSPDSAACSLRTARARRRIRPQGLDESAVAVTQGGAAIERLASRPFDLLVIGGGIVGAGIAATAARAGLAVALVDKGDFGAGTSTASSKLIHGGLRYLRLGDVRLVREALHERRLLTQVVAPQLVRRLPFLFPLYRNGPYGPATIQAGLVLYGAFARSRLHRLASPERARELVPSLRLDGLRSCGVYADATTHDGRLCLANMRAVEATEAEVAQILEEAAVAVEPGLLRADAIRSTYAGLRVLPSGDGSTASARRETVFHRGGGGMLSVAGGKLTTYRRIALDVLSMLRAELGLHRLDRRAFPLPGAVDPGEAAQRLARRWPELEVRVYEHLAHHYGSLAEDVLAPAEQEPELLRPLHPDGPDVAAQAVYARDFEWARRPEDVLRRRTTLALRGLAGEDVVRRVDELFETRAGETPRAAGVPSSPAP